MCYPTFKMGNVKCRTLYKRFILHNIPIAFQLFKVILLYMHGHWRRSFNENLYDFILSQKVGHAATKPSNWGNKIIRSMFLCVWKHLFEVFAGDWGIRASGLLFVVPGSCVPEVSKNRTAFILRVMNQFTACEPSGISYPTIRRNNPECLLLQYEHRFTTKKIFKRWAISSGKVATSPLH